MTTFFDPSDYYVGQESTGVDFTSLRNALSGAVILPNDPSYDEARRVHNLTIDRYPAAIVRAATTDDVAAAVRFARLHRLPLAVRSGGHSLPGHSSVDDALVVDLSSMKGVVIDAEQRTATVQAGATSADLAAPAHAYGLALSTGDTGTVGLGGLVTGGGIGYMVRKHGLAIDNLLWVEVVTNDGSVVHANEEMHPDLFWAVRGGGGNFGIVTRFGFRLAPVGSVYGGLLVLPVTRETVRAVLEYARSAPDELTTISHVWHAPPAPFIPEAQIGELSLMILVCYTGDPEEGARVVQPLRDLATPIADLVGPIPYPAMYQFMAAAEAPIPSRVRSTFAHELSDSAIDAILASMAEATSPMSMVQLRVLGGAMARVDQRATAFAHRDKTFMASVIGMWPELGDDATHFEWVQALFEELRPEGAGVYANFLGDEGEARVREAYPDEVRARLAEIKARYDAENVFAFNQNISPATAERDIAA